MKSTTLYTILTILMFIVAIGITALHVTGHLSKEHFDASIIIACIILVVFMTLLSKNLHIIE